MAYSDDTQGKVLHTLRAVLKRDNSLSQCCAINALEKLNARDEDSKQGLIELLRDPDPDVRINAAIALGRMQIEEAIEPLIGNLEHDPEGDVRIEATKALARIRSEAVVEPLIRCFQQDGYPELDLLVDDTEYSACWEVQSQALNALGEIGDQRATQPVIEVLENPDYEDLQESGFQVLAQLNNDQAKAFLLEQLKKGERLAKRRAVRALTVLPELQNEGQDLSAELLNAFINALLDSDASVRLYAAQALGGSVNPLVVVPLTLLLTDPDMEVRKEVVDILGRMRGREIVDRLLPLLNESNSGLKRQIVRVLGEIGDPAAQAPLSALLESQDQTLLYAVVRALGQIGDSGPESKLADILADLSVHANIRAQTAWTLGQILEGVAPTNASEDTHEQLNPRAILASAVFDEDSRVCHAALSALVELDPAQAITTLVNLLRGNTQSTEEETSPDEPVEEALSEGMQEMLTGHDAKTSTLAAILARPPEVHEPPIEAKTLQPSLRILAARLLGGLDAPGAEAIQALSEAATEGGSELQREALVALGQIGDLKALPVLIQGLESGQRDIRLAALDALANLNHVY